MKVVSLCQKTLDTPATNCWSIHVCTKVIRLETAEKLAETVRCIATQYSKTTSSVIVTLSSVNVDMCVVFTGIGLLLMCP
jgi:hypothetical protein